MALLGLGLLPSISEAGLQITLGNPGNLVQNNVGHFVVTTPNTIAQGPLLSGGANVLQIQTDTDLEIGGNGSADIQAVSTGFGKITVTPVGALGFTGLAINLVGADNSKSTYKIEAYDQNGLADTESGISLGNGANNRSYVLPLDAVQYITKLVVTAESPGISSILNVQINATVLRPTAVPEPTTLIAAASGVGMIGLRQLRKRRAKVA